MEKQVIFSLPLPSTAVIRGPILANECSDLLLSMDFDDEGQRQSASLRFVKQRAFRKRAEIYCTGWHIKDTYDTVCEIQNSDWVDELRKAAPPEWRDQWVMRHFIIYLDSFGCLEVIAESAEIKDQVVEMKSAGM